MTAQGEGPAAGRNAAFLRFGGCNLSCSWCDSKYTWDATAFDLREQIRNTTADGILERMPAADIVVVTGGEPLLNQNNPAWLPLIIALHGKYRELHLETNGTIAPSVDTITGFNHITVSPKLANAGAHRGRQDPTMARAWVGVPQAIVKYVVTGPDDVATAVALAREAGFPDRRIWVMPEGRTTEILNDRWPAIATAAAAAGINATHRLHVLAWGDTRGH